MTCEELAVEVLGPGTDATTFETESFIALGGDSLRAMKLIALAEERLGLRIPAAALLGGAPLRSALAEAAPAAAESGSAPDTEPAAQPGSTPLSHTQKGMWLIERLTGGSPYNLVFIVFVDRGTLDPDTFERAVAATVDRHEGLRTVVVEHDGSVEQKVLATSTPQISVLEHDGAPDDFDDFVRAAAAKHGRFPFDLATAPGLRFLRMTHPAGRHAVVLMAHHMVLDGAALGHLLTELFARYDALEHGAPDPFPGPAATLQALTRHQEAVRAGGAWERQGEFWAKHLDGVPSVLHLPADRQRPTLQEAAGARTALDLGPAATTAIVQRAREVGVTPYALLLAALGLTLHRWTGARSLLVGVPLAGRNTSELAELIAVTSNLVPVRIDVDDELPAFAFLRAVQHSLTLSMDNGALPFEEIVERLGIERSLGCHPLVQVCFGMHDQLVPQHLATRAAHLRVEESHGGGAQFDISVLVGQSTPSLAGHVEYATSVWTAAEAEGFVADFRTAAEQLATTPDTALETVRCVAPQRLALLDGINDVRRDFPALALDELFRTVARQSPDSVAVREGAIQLTYAGLAGAAAEQARRLRESGVQPGDTVLVGVDRSIAEIVGVLGVIWAGAAYVGVDLAAPTAYTDQILAKVKPAAALVSPAAAATLADRGIALVDTWEPSWPGFASRPADALSATGSGGTDQLAYVAFTSGSTGQPKGVAVPHRAVVRLVHEAGYVTLGAGQRMLRLSPLAFDASTLEIWGALLTGAAIEVHPAGLPAPSELGRFLIERGVTVAWLTAGLFRLVQEFAPAGLGGLRQLLTGGDVVPHEHVIRALERHPGLVITNGYGPTENTTFTTTHSVRRPEDVDGPLPIGVPVPGTRVYVLDERGRRVPPGAVGELYTSGEGLADGYFGDEAETAKSFGCFAPEVPERLYRTGDLVRLDTQGRLRFLGRRDAQVKLRGYRIELSAISDALTAHPEVSDAVVVVTDGDSAEKRLIAAVVPARGATVTTAGLRDFLNSRLPSYMVPTLWAMVEHIPVTRNGKVDRQALAAVAGPAVAAAAPAAPAEPARPAEPHSLAAVSALFVAAIDRADLEAELTADTDFFMVGGNSLAAVRLVRLVKEQLGVSLRLREFLLSPTPAGLQTLIAKGSVR